MSPLIGRKVRITGGTLASIWDDNKEHVIDHVLPEDDQVVRVTTPWGSLWIALDGNALTTLHGELVPELPSQIGTLDDLDALPVGSVVTYPFGDTEGNVAERTSDRNWLITGESGLWTTEGLMEYAERTVYRPFTVLRRGYGDES